MIKRIGSIVGLLAACALLSGCFAPVVEGARQGVEVIKRGSFEAEANAGEAPAQYKMGNTYCCESGPQVERSLSVYDNQKATEWLCKSALQDYGPAQYKLASIYAGEHSGGGMISRVGGLIGEKQTALPTAWVWASRANANGVDKAAKLRDQINDKLTPQDRLALQDSLDHWRSLPCTWNSVIQPQVASNSAAH